MATHPQVDPTLVITDRDLRILDQCTASNAISWYHMLGLPVLGALAWGGITSFIFPNNPTLRFFITAGLSFLWGFYAMHVVKDIYGKGGSFILHMAQRLYGIDPQLMQRDVTRVMARALQQITDDEENHGK